MAIIVLGPSEGLPDIADLADQLSNEPDDTITAWVSLVVEEQLISVEEKQVPKSWTSLIAGIFPGEFPAQRGLRHGSAERVTVDLRRECEQLIQIGGASRSGVTAGVSSAPIPSLVVVMVARRSGEWRAV